LITQTLDVATAEPTAVFVVASSTGPTSLASFLSPTDKIFLLHHFH